MVKKISSILIIFAIIIISFLSNYNSYLKDFVITAKTQDSNLNMYVQTATQLIDDLAEHGNTFLEGGGSNESVLYNLITYDQTKGSYNMDAVGNTVGKASIGNLTGIGKIPDSGIFREEINLALNYNKFFSSYYDKFPDIAWLYYTSENNFVTIYPWIPSNNFAFSEKLKKVEYYRIVTPQNNPLHERKWSSVYMDSAGKGDVVTLSKPVYYKNRFMGVVSLDLTNTLLTKLINSKCKSYLYDSSNVVLAVNQKGQEEFALKGLNEYLHLSDAEFNKLKNTTHNKVEKIGDNYIYLVGFDNAPWTLMITVSVWTIIGKSVLPTIPIAGSLILMFLIIIEIQRRRKRDLEYAAAVATTTDMFLLIDMEGHLIQCNDATCEILGYSRKKIFSLSIENLVWGKSREKIL